MNEDQTEQTQARILIVDDLTSNIDILRRMLAPHGYEILVAPNGEIALTVAQRATPDLILLDVLMPEMEGYQVCRRLKAEETTADIPVIFITAKDDIEGVVEGFRVGGVDYIQKPFSDEEILARVQTHLSVSQLTKALQQKNNELTRANEELRCSNERLRLEIEKRESAENALKTADEKFSLVSQREAERWGIAGFVAQSQTMAKILADIRRLQNNDTTSVLIGGESGTGKELVARAIHFGGPRSKETFIPVNCAAIPRELVESILFGHVKGDFTGADTSKKGCFELANRGTLFLDEIGEMPAELQAKLLRVIEDGIVTPVGGTQPMQVDVRILAATNVDLQAQVASGHFREDLYYRLARFPVVVPPLRERVEDIPLLTRHFLSLLSTEMGYKTPKISDPALEVLKAYPFPGNVRELKNIIERALIESAGGDIQPKHLHFPHARATPSATPPDSEEIAAPWVSTLPINLREAERLLIQRALEMTNGNVTEAARLLGVSRKKVYSVTRWKKNKESEA
ncbi:sigma-54-dependent Fis family transcriptional regulator [Candidatus Poribacteria bacterium]|nr:sigma-54-dependent Fis family transcriptional regulator [Candidatus Poribacteria bacterium]